MSDDTTSPNSSADDDGRQRRQNVRVTIQLPVRVTINGRTWDARTRDVSAAGFGFSLRGAVELEQTGDADLELDGWHLHSPFTVRFVRPIIAGCQVGVQFDELSTETREQLVRQVFDYQREQLKNE